MVLNEFISDPQFGGWVTVKVWQNVSQRAALSRRLGVQSAMLLGSVFLTASLILWFGIQLGLKPVADLREATGARNPADLRPIRRWVPPEMRPLVGATNSLLQRLAKAISLRDAFISDAAHQVRNPSAAIQAQAESALTAPGEATLRARVRDVATAARDIGRLSNQLLSIERVRGRTLRALSEEANLLDNAAIYGVQTGGEVRVVLIYSEQDVTLHVNDDGSGIPPELRTRIFDRFFRNDPDQTRGSGLGLSIVEDVAKARGGHALCFATEKGATFKVRLPT
jgi:two-component system sensor histidine kinase TctE